MAKRWWVIGIAILAALGLGAAALLRDGGPSREQEIRQLIDSAYSHQRPGGGRLSAARYTPPAETLAKFPELGKAQVLLLRQPASATRQRLQETIYLAAGEWQQFLDLAGERSGPGDPAILNNIGASLLALSEENPTFLLKALDAFESARDLDRRALEPLFNLVVTYRKLRFPKLADEALRQYSLLDSNSSWQSELSNQGQADEGSILDRLERSVRSNNMVEAEKLFLANPELCRRIAMEYALKNQQGSPDLMHFIAAQMQQHYGDKTVAAMLEPLFTDQRARTIELRNAVNKGAELFVNGNYDDSLQPYVEAAKLASDKDSFDSLWIDLNRADTLIRLAKFDDVRETLARIDRFATERGLLWLKAKALSFYGGSLRITSTYAEMINLLSTADRMFTDLGAPRDRIRVLYYLSYYRYFGGDQGEALRLALECLRLVNDDEAIRISTLDWLIGSILHQRGMDTRAVLFAKESVEQSRKGPYAGGVEFTSSITLSQLYESMAQHDLAQQYLDLAEEAFDKIPTGFDRTTDELRLGIVKAKAKLNQQNYGEAESLLERNLKIYSDQPFSATPLLSQSLMLSARVYSETGRIRQAAARFTQAIDVVEKDGEYLKTEVLRVKFDDERRELYDSAIEFEYKNGSIDAAWSYLQKYRAKLFLEFLAAFNPELEPPPAGLNRQSVQRRLPKDTQIVEYALLKDRLLIWLVSNKTFEVRSVAVTRADIEAKVQSALEKLRRGNDADPLLSELGKLLIEPISTLLDPDRTLTIIPDRALHGLPFGALKRLPRANYLVEDFPIVISPSLTHFLTGSSAQPHRDSIVAFGSQNGGVSEFKELASLADVYPKAATFAGPQVDKSSFLKGLKSAAVFHYAGHSVTDAVDPLRSSILLDGNRSGPNSVTAVDIAQQRLPNNAVVILSSCDSSVGNSRDGVGVRGLTSAFLIGGAGTVVGSLWPVEASSTADLMIRFHRAFAKSGMPAAKALREAQLAFMKAFPSRSHPYYWSGFVVTGNFSALR